MLTHSTGNGYQEIYGDDTLSRVNRIDTKIDGSTWTTSQTFNVTTSTAKLLWEQQYDSDARGQLVRFKLGNGVMTQTEADEISGRLSRIVTGKLSGTNTANRLYGDIGGNKSITAESEVFQTRLKVLEKILGGS